MDVHKASCNLLSDNNGMLSPRMLMLIGRNYVYLAYQAKPFARCRRRHKRPTLLVSLGLMSLQVTIIVPGLRYSITLMAFDVSALSGKPLDEMVEHTASLPAFSLTPFLSP
jgi:hypothetical protein